ncbi:MAG: histidine kinase [Actinobacteria bacterium]|nr:histidine kinase [Actinomycetota bacterium]
MPWARRTTFLLWGVSVALLALTVVAVRDLAEPAGTWIVGGTVLASLVPFAAGWLATRHDPANWVGTWLTAAGTNILLQMAHGNWADALAAAPSDLPASAVLLNLTQGVWMGWFVPFAMVLLLFPDGRPADRRARRTVFALLGSVVAFNLLLAVAPGPLMPPLQDWPRPFGEHWVGYGSIPALLVFYGSLVMAALATRRRYRAASDEVARARLRWMFLTCLTVPATILLCWAGYLLTGTPVVALGGLIAMNVAIPAATLVAMLRHELHDGAQQRLVSLGMRLRVAQHQVASGGSVALDPLVDDAVEELALAVRELREIAHGLRPSCLDDGLGPALESLSRSSALPVHVSYSGGDLPDHVSVTAYYVASEGVTNAVKHSGARRVALDVRRTDDGLHVAVHDDGAGGARIAGGTGLAMLHDRVRALGGRLSVTDRQPAGTSLVAVIPCGS